MYQSMRDYVLDEKEMSSIEFDNLQKFYNNIMDKRIYDKQDFTQISKKYNKYNKLLTDEALYIRNLANLYLEESGLKQNVDIFMIEYWRHRLFNDEMKHIFPIHCDNDGLISGEVNTCIFYLRKDKLFTGGDLNIYSNSCFPKILEVIETTAMKILLFDGNIYHSVSKMKGIGIRDCIVVQFSKK